jgi:drug/metabolite transporter (DMT)-like permease
VQHRGSADPVTIGALTVAIIAVSSSAPMIVFADAPAVAIAFWRNGLAVCVLLPMALLRRRREMADLVFGASRREALWCVLAGVALAAHFLCWVPSTRLTSVAAATALCATQPVWQGLIAVGQGKRLPGWTWVGIGFAVVGAIAATGADVSVAGTAVAGDLLAVAGGMFAAVYTAFGERARVTTSTTSYTAICYTVCALITLGVCLIWRVPLHAYPTSAWLAILGITIGPQLLGHTLFNFSVKRVAATTISVLILLEAPGAALIGWLWLGQVPEPASLPGLALLIAGVAIVVVAGRRVRSAGRVPIEAEAGVVAS